MELSRLRFRLRSERRFTMATTPNKIEVTVNVTTRPADVLDQVAKQFSEAADVLRILKAAGNN